MMNFIVLGLYSIHYFVLLKNIKFWSANKKTKLKSLQDLFQYESWMLIYNQNNHQDNTFNSHAHSDILFSTQVEEGIDVLLAQFMQDDIDQEIFCPDTSSDFGDRALDDFEDEFITECVDIFQEVDINQVNYQAQLDSNFNNFFNDMHKYIDECF